jgi:hypothetical protein
MPKSAHELPANLPPDVMEALQQGNKIEAIKRLREQTGLGLKEAKDVVDAAQPAVRTTLQGGAPGEVVRPGRVIGWLLAIALAGLAVYYLLQRIT